MLKQISAIESAATLSDSPYVLLVEDEPITQKVHTLMLTKLGCKVDLASTGTQALAMCPNDYDVILLDCGLPDIDGFELDKRLRDQEQLLGIADRPHIMLTAFTLDSVEVEFQSASINDFATKPIALHSLRALIQKWACLATVD